LCNQSLLIKDIGFTGFIPELYGWGFYRLGNRIAKKCQFCSSTPAMAMENSLEKFLTAVAVTLGLVVLQHSINPDTAANVSSDNNTSAMSTHTSLLRHP
jgi:hypothetical protein